MSESRFTAQEMREVAEGLVDSCVADNISILVGHRNLKVVKGDRIVAMLRQSADAEEELAKVKARLEAVVKECERHIVVKCKKCKLSLNGEPRTIRGEPCNWHSDCNISEYEIHSSHIYEKILRVARGEGDTE